MKFSAPGKAVLLGEYAVLDGGLALVAAINARATGICTGGAAPPSAVLEAVFAEAKARGHTVPSGVSIDTADFRNESGEKIGLGSSGAAALLASALVTGKGDERTLDLAISAHRAASGGRGSGIDVASSFYGGVIAAKRQPGELSVVPPRMPGLEIFFLFTQTSVSTSNFVKACQSGPQWQDWVQLMKAIAEQGIRAYQRQDAQAFIAQVAKYGRAMQQLGQASGAPIVTEQIEAVMKQTAKAGGVAKPSGAGGGDIVVGWLPTNKIDAATQIAQDTHCIQLNLTIDPQGLRHH